MKYMMNRVFLDSNILIYLYAIDETEKTKKIQALLKKYEHILISTQVLFEFSHVMHRKLKRDYNDIEKAIFATSSNVIVMQVLKLKDTQSKLRWRLATHCVENEISPLSNKNKIDLCNGLLAIEKDKKRIATLQSVLRKIDAQEKAAQKDLLNNHQSCGQCSVTIITTEN